MEKKIKFSICVDYNYIKNEIEVYHELFEIRNIKLLEGRYGLFLAMPSKKVGDEWKKTLTLDNFICEKIIEKIRDVENDVYFTLDITEDEWNAHERWESACPDLSELC